LGEIIFLFRYIRANENIFVAGESRASRRKLRREPNRFCFFNLQSRNVAIPYAWKYVRDKLDLSLRKDGRFLLARGVKRRENRPGGV